MHIDLERILGAFLVLAMTVGPDPAAKSDCDGVSEVANTDLRRVTIASGLTAGRSGPLFVTAPPEDRDRIFIVLQNGVIRQLARGAAPTAHTVFLDIDARVNSNGDEQGLLGLAFGPQFATDGTFYVNYTRNDGDTIVSRFQTHDRTPGTSGDPNSEVVLLRIDQPETNHNGGWMSFGPDGYLYIAQGDGGGFGDRHGTCGNGQSTQTLLGKLLRIDPTGAAGSSPDCGLDAGPYTIPPGNPYADGRGTGHCDELWSIGLRNPWRSSFDVETGDLYVGDVGQNCWEEINWTPGGSVGRENYGWRRFEGRHCYDGAQGCLAPSSQAGCGPLCQDPAPAGDAEPDDTVRPIWEYSSGIELIECTVVGGYVYRGCRMPKFRGTYFYGDYCTGEIFSFEQVGGAMTNHRPWAPQLSAALQFDLTSFGTDAEGELYITDRDGLVYAVVPPLADFELAGTGAAGQLRLDKFGDWTWEDLHATSWHPISAYRVYRAVLADGTFGHGERYGCIRTSAAPVWPSGGDLTDPEPKELFAYIVTAVNAAGEQTRPGGSPARTLDTSGCP